VYFPFPGTICSFACLFVKCALCKLLAFNQSTQNATPLCWKSFLCQQRAQMRSSLSDTISRVFTFPLAMCFYFLENGFIYYSNFKLSGKTGLLPTFKRIIKLFLKRLEEFSSLENMVFDFLLFHRKKTNLFC